MATNNFLVFDEQKQNILSNEAYSTNQQRLSGVSQGIASSQLQNKQAYQASVMAKAIGDLLVDNGLDASDANASNLYTNIKKISLATGLTPKILWQYVIFPDSLTPAEKAEVEGNPDLMDLVKGNGLNGKIGDIKTTALDLSGKGYLLCDGSGVKQSVYPELYNILGTKYGLLTDGRIFQSSIYNSNTTTTQKDYALAYYNGVYMAAGHDGVYRSTDDMETWSKIYSLSSSYAVFGVYQANGIFYCNGSRSHGFASSDNGDSWNEINGGYHNLPVTYHDGLYATFSTDAYNSKTPQKIRISSNGLTFSDAPAVESRSNSQFFINIEWCDALKKFVILRLFYDNSNSKRINIITTSDFQTFNYTDTEAITGSTVTAGQFAIKGSYAYVNMGGICRIHLTTGEFEMLALSGITYSNAYISYCKDTDLFLANGAQNYSGYAYIFNDTALLTSNTSGGNGFYVCNDGSYFYYVHASSAGKNAIKNSGVSLTANKLPDVTPRIAWIRAV